MTTTGAPVPARTRGPLCVTGAGSVLLDKGDRACDSTEFLKVRKTRKFMGLQDDLAVVAAGRALTSAGLLGNASPLDPTRTGLFLAVGYIPFAEEDILPVLAASLDEDGAFSIGRFGAGGFRRAHPLLTFRCLPNMPAYHVSANFDVQGPYCVAYPGPAQFYGVLDEAETALDDGRIDVALVGGVAAQSNFLVHHHFSRILQPTPADQLRDIGAFIVLETEAGARRRDATLRARLESVRSAYEPPDVLHVPSESKERVLFTTPQGDSIGLDDKTTQVISGDALGPGLLPFALDVAVHAQESPGRGGIFRHTLDSRDGVHAESIWVLP